MQPKMQSWYARKVAKVASMSHIRNRFVSVFDPGERSHWDLVICVKLDGRSRAFPKIFFSSFAKKNFVKEESTFKINHPLRLPALPLSGLHRFASLAIICC
jgi:hypothetical protein